MVMSTPTAGSVDEGIRHNVVPHQGVECTQSVLCHPKLGLTTIGLPISKCVVSICASFFLFSSSHSHIRTRLYFLFFILFLVYDGARGLLWPFSCHF
jgi:hypothetical protein